MKKSPFRRLRITQLSAFLLGIMLTFISVVICIGISLAIQDYRYRDRIYPGVTIDGTVVNTLPKDTLLARYKLLNQKLKEVKLTIAFEQTPVATVSGEMFAYRTNGYEVAEQALLIARQGTWLTQVKEKLQILLGLRTFDFETKLEFDPTHLTDIFMTLQTQYNVDPHDALFEMKDGKVTAFKVEKNGLAVNSQEVMAQIIHDLTDKKTVAKNLKATKPLTYTAVTKVVKPDVTLAQANTHGIEEVIGEGTSDYTHSIPGRIHNLLLASDHLHGTLIPKGGTFSYVDAVGEISARTGYQQAYVIVNGRTELGDGGGVCQTSTTVFRAAINSGLPITEWTPHAYRVGYYENDSKPGRDATIYSPSVDLKFVNDTPAAILIQVEKDTENLKLIYRFWGKKDKRKISISDVSMSTPIPAPPARYQDDPSLKRGVTKQVDWAANGLKAWFDYKVENAGKTTFEKKFVSNYKPWQAVYLVGTKD